MRGLIKKISLVSIGVSLIIGLVNVNFTASATVPGVNQLISTKYDGTKSNGTSSSSLISANGKVVAFKSNATNILATGGKGVFVKDISNGTTERISISTSGVISDDTSYTSPAAISATGRYVVFSSRASNLIDGVTTPTSVAQLYLRDRVASTTELITQTSSGITSNAGSWALGVSSDGRFVAFSSSATNLHVDASDAKGHLYMLDRIEDSLTVLDRDSSGAVGNSTIWPPVGTMSCDGSLIAFNYPDSLVEGEGSGHVDIYLLDRRGATDKMTNLTAFANAAALAPTISCNGDFIGFESRANNLDTTITTSLGYNRPYVYDRVNQTFHLLAVTTGGASINVETCGTTPGGMPSCMELSDTGVALFKDSSSLLTGDSGTQVFMRNIYSGETQTLTKSSSGVAGNASSGDMDISADGRTAVYASGSNNLVSGDTNGYTDVFTSVTGY